MHLHCCGETSVGKEAEDGVFACKAEWQWQVRAGPPEVETLRAPRQQVLHFGRLQLLDQPWTSKVIILVTLCARSEASVVTCKVDGGTLWNGAFLQSYLYAYTSAP